MKKSTFLILNLLGAVATSAIVSSSVAKKQARGNIIILSKKESESHESTGEQDFDEFNPMLAKIKHMHKQFGITSEDIPDFSSEEKKFRITAMQEELDEYSEALTVEDELDALLDLTVFALGTLERQGLLPIAEQAYNRIMIANCDKTLGPNDKRGSFSLDLVKPKNWRAPYFSDLLLKIGK